MNFINKINFRKQLFLEQLASIRFMLSLKTLSINIVGADIDLYDFYSLFDENDFLGLEKLTLNIGNLNRYIYKID